MNAAARSAGPAPFNDFSALDLWRRTLTTTVKGALPDLTQRQLALLLTVYLAPPPHTVRGLSETLGISKPAVTRALDRLGELGFARRKADERDRRSVVVQRTVKGSVFLREFGAAIAVCAREAAEEPLGVAAFTGAGTGVQSGRS